MSVITEGLSDWFGEDLRSVGSYDTDSAQFKYVRDDIRAAYENGDFDRVLQEARLEAIDQAYQESLYVHGNLECTIRCFEEATELHFIQGGTSGVIAAVDAGTIDDLRGTLDACLNVIRLDAGLAGDRVHSDDRHSKNGSL